MRVLYISRTYLQHTRPFILNSRIWKYLRLRQPKDKDRSTIEPTVRSQN